MEADVFIYFVAIGSGLTLGVAMVALPGLYFGKKIITGKANKGGKKHGIL